MLIKMFFWYYKNLLSNYVKNVESIFYYNFIGVYTFYTFADEDEVIDLHDCTVCQTGVQLGYGVYGDVVEVAYRQSQRMHHEEVAHREAEQGKRQILKRPVDDGFSRMKAQMRGKAHLHHGMVHFVKAPQRPHVEGHGEHGVQDVEQLSREELAIRALDEEEPALGLSYSADVAPVEKV